MGEFWQRRIKKQRENLLALRSTQLNTDAIIKYVPMYDKNDKGAQPLKMDPQRLLLGNKGIHMISILRRRKV